MSTNRPPHPHSHPHDHDLQPKRWADASETDADALDALLNEIAQGNGFPSTQSGHGRRRPDARSDDGGPAGEAGALHAAARSFHRRFDAAQGRDPGFAAVDPHLWEQIMTATTNPAPETRRAQGAVWVNATRHALAPGVSPRSPHHARQRWGGFANATLTLIILLAGFGVWRFYDGLNGSGPVEPAGNVPGVAMQPATPEATAFPPAEAPPAATPAPITACNFSADIPLFPEVDVSPIDGTALLLTTDGDLVLTCPEEPDQVVLASGIDHASPLGWPGIVSLIGQGESGAEPISVINVITGRSIRIGVPPETMTFQWTQPEGTPWLVALSNEDTSDWAITDLRTMESRLYSDVAGTAVPEGAVLSASAGQGSEAIVAMPWRGATGEWRVTGFSGTALVPHDSLDSVQKISLPDGPPRITEIVLAPDGRHLALKTTEDGDIPTGNTTYTIVRVSDGAEVVRSNTFEDPMSTMRWVQGGEGLAYTANTSLHVLSTDPDQVPTTMLERTTNTLAVLGTTYDPDVVIVHRVGNDDLATEIPLGIDQRIFSVNTATGNVIEINGFDASHTTSPWDQDTRFLVMYEPELPEPDTTTYQVIDAVTGEVIDEIPDVPGATDIALAPGWRSVASTDDGSTEVIAFGAQHIYLMHMENGEPVVRQITSPPGLDPDANGQVEVFLSPDGSMLSLTLSGDESRNRWLLPLDGEPDNWIEVPGTIVEPGYGPENIVFVRGTGA